jgi:hypothetical protein
MRLWRRLGGSRQSPRGVPLGLLPSPAALSALARLSTTIRFSVRGAEVRQAGTRCPFSLFTEATHIILFLQLPPLFTLPRRAGAWATLPRCCCASILWVWELYTLCIDTQGIPRMRLLVEEWGCWAEKCGGAGGCGVWGAAWRPVRSSMGWCGELRL